MKLQGYHNTETSNINDIFQNGFIGTPNRKH